MCVMLQGLQVYFGAIISFDSHNNPVRWPNNETKVQRGYRATSDLTRSGRAEIGVSIFKFLAYYTRLPSPKHRDKLFFSL